MTTSAPTATDPTHPCLRCGAPVAVTESLCDRCNPARLAQPAASQAHGTVYAGVVIAVIALALAAQYLLGGVGPFAGRVVSAAADGDGLKLTLEVRNAGSRAGSATCRVWDPAVLGGRPVETTIRTPIVPAGTAATFEQRVAALGGIVRQLAVECSR